MGSVLRAPRKKSFIEPVVKWKVLRGDQVQVMVGKDKGKVGNVLRVDRKHNRVVVEGANLVTKHIKATKQHPGARVTKESGLHYSNVAVLDPVSGEPCRVGFRFAEDGSKVRVNKRTGAVVPKPDAAKERKHPLPDAPGPKDTPVEVATQPSA